MAPIGASAIISILSLPIDEEPFFRALGLWSLTPARDASGGSVGDDAATGNAWVVTGIVTGMCVCVNVLM